MATLIVIAGQSKALGFGMSAETSPVSVVPKTYIFTPQSNYWGVLTPGVNTGGFNSPEAWGPEVGIALKFREAYPDEPLLIVKVAKGSTPLAQSEGLDWSPLSDDELFDLTTETIARAQSAFATSQQTEPPPVSRVFWMQGETDATDPQWALHYGENLGGFVSAVRAHWMHNPEGDVIAGRIGDAQAYALDVRIAQWALAQTDPHFASFRTLDFDLQPDGVHFSAEGLLSLGYAFFDEWML